MNELPVDLFTLYSSIKDSFYFLDIDECNASKQLCDPNAKCINTHRSYYCSCFSGFSGDGKTCKGK